MAYAQFLLQVASLVVESLSFILSDYMWSIILNILGQSLKCSYELQHVISNIVAF